MYLYNVYNVFKDINYRKGFKNHINETIIVKCKFQKYKNPNVVFEEIYDTKNIYICDHINLKMVDLGFELEVGEEYYIKGKVEKYTKNVNGNYIYNLGMNQIYYIIRKVSEVSLTEIATLKISADYIDKYEEREMFYKKIRGMEEFKDVKYKSLFKFYLKELKDKNLSNNHIKKCLINYIEKKFVSVEKILKQEELIPKEEFIKRFRISKKVNNIEELYEYYCLLLKKFKNRRNINKKFRNALENNVFLTFE